MNAYPMDGLLPGQFRQNSRLMTKLILNIVQSFLSPCLCSVKLLRFQKVIFGFPHGVKADVAQTHIQEKTARKLPAIFQPVIQRKRLPDIALLQLLIRLAKKLLRLFTGLSNGFVT